MTIRAMIVDDELAAIGNLSDLLIERGGVDIVGEYTNPLVAMESLRNIMADIVFLDIEMPEIDGMTMANQILDICPRMKIVFVTAYQEYAVEAFKLNATDYLLKPVVMERLAMTLDRVQPGQMALAEKRKLKVRCFGKLQVDDDGRTVKWRTTKAEELFAFLLDQNGKGVGKEKLLTAIWSDFEERRAMTNFNTSLYYMRRTLREVGFPELLIVSNGTFMLDMEQIDSDANRFEACLTQLNALNRHNADQFAQVVEQCDEGYLEANYFEWADEKRRVFDKEYTEMAVAVAEYYKKQHMTREAMAMLKKGLLKDNCHPGLNKVLLKLYWETGDRYSALKHYEEYRWRLKHELGLEPDPSIRELMNQMNET